MNLCGYDPGDGPLRDDIAALTEQLAERDAKIGRLYVENEQLRELLRGWRDAAETAQDVTFAPIAKATDDMIPGLRWSLRF